MKKECCVRCGQPINRPDWKQSEESIHWIEKTTKGYHQITITLCDRCLTKFYFWIGLDNLLKDE